MKVGDVKGYEVTYEPRDKLFYLVDSDGERVAQGKTQEEVEAQAPKLSKQKHGMPIEAFIKSGLKLELGNVTSVNPADKSVRFVKAKEPDSRYSPSHVKIRLRYGEKLHEATASNRQLAEKVDILHGQIKQKEQEIEQLMKQIKKGLPEEVQAEIEKRADKIRNVEDLAAVINSLYAKFGGTLDKNYLLFSFGGQTHLMIKLNKDTFKKVREIVERCGKEGTDINNAIDEVLNAAKG